MGKSAPEDGRSRLARLMAARLATSVAVLGLALVFVGPGEEAQEAARGLYGSIAAAFLCTAIFAAVLPWVRRIEPYAVLQITVDLALVTSAVLFTGGGRSIFSFLYLPIVVLGAILFGRRGGYGAAIAASMGFACVVALGQPGLGSEAVDPAEVKFAIWGMHTGGLVLVAMLSTTLARELRAADADLEASRAELVRLEALHQRTIESVTSGLLTTGAAGRVLSCNPEGEAILGLEKDRILGRLADEVLPGVGRLMEKPASDARRQRTRLQLPRADGRVQHLGVAVSVLRSIAGKPDGHVVIFQDVTQVVELEAELQRSARLAGVGELAASIAHEIRNPLAAISGSVQMLERKGEPEDRRLHAIVLREIDRLDRLISDFLLYARPNPPKIETIEIARLFEELQQVDAGGTAGLSCEAPPGLTVEADSAQLRQVLWNLVRNAQDASPEGAEVRLSARALDPQATGGPGRNASEGGGGVEICVTDAGEGIEPDKLERIFDPFFTTKEEGTGLGLPTVHRILDAHDAAVHVESRPGVGTTFHLLFGCGAREIS